MNRHQKDVLRNFVVVVAITIIAVVALINFKDWINRSEAMRAMDHLGRVVLQYRKEHGAVPSEPYVLGIRKDLEGQARLGNLKYRARWLRFESTGDEILAYSEKNYHSLVIGEGFVVLRLDGRVQWMEKEKFQPLLAGQQSEEEIAVIQLESQD